MKHEPAYERGAAVISIDTEQIWGHMDLLDEEQFEERYPNTRETHRRLLDLLCREGISATWTLVGMFCSSGSKGEYDERVSGLPTWWTHQIPAGNELTEPLWYNRSFVERLIRARMPQDLGMHGGISHLVWGDPRVTASLASRELRAGIRALNDLGIRPVSFVFPRDLEAHLPVLREAGIRAYRGRTPILSERFGYGKFSSVLRTGEEWFKTPPLIVWPEETLPGLWNLPASMFIYNLGKSRSRLVPPRLRVDRTRIGLEAAIKQQGVFHLGLHPENLAESTFALSIFEKMIEEICRYRDRNGLEVLTLAGTADRSAIRQPVREWPITAERVAQ
jgi:hypothetical protein